MSYQVNIIRNININNKSNQKKLKITNIKKQEWQNLDPFLTMFDYNESDADARIQEVFYDNDNKTDYWLYDFSMNWKDYKEFISKKIYSNSNSEDIIIDYNIKSELDNPVLVEEYIQQWWECPKCTDSYYQVINNEYICQNNECQFEWQEKDFFND